MERILIKFDAACKNEPGKNCPMGLGVAVFINDEYAEELSVAEHFTTEDILGTSNVGEWNALIRALEVAISLRKHYPKNPMAIFGDSQLVVNQFNLIWRVKEENFRPFLKRARELNQQAKVGDIYWIPRTKNTHADDLSKLGLYGEEGEFRYWIKGIHSESDSEWVEFESNDLKEIKRHWWLIEATDLDIYEIWDRKKRKEIIISDK